MKIEWPVGQLGAMREMPLRVMEHDAGDCFEFEFAQAGMGVIGGRAWDSFDVQCSLTEVDFSNVPLTLSLEYGALPTEEVLGEDTLSFAGIPPVTVQAVLLEIQAAELLYSHLRACQQGLDPSRLNDLRDLALIAAQSGLDGRALFSLLAQTFARNKTMPPPGLPDPFEGWAEPMRKMAAAAGDPSDFLPGYDGVLALFDPLLRGDVLEGTWDATSRCWREPGSEADEGLPPL